MCRGGIAFFHDSTKSVEVKRGKKGNPYQTAQANGRRENIVRARTTSRDVPSHVADISEAFHSSPESQESNLGAPTACYPSPVL
jgi:hypothetical protein